MSNDAKERCGRKEDIAINVETVCGSVPVVRREGDSTATELRKADVYGEELKTHMGGFHADTLCPEHDPRRKRRPRVYTPRLHDCGLRFGDVFEEASSLTIRFDATLTAKTNLVKLKNTYANIP
ncbi:hypothetical protein EVAR_80920_1 [Eumeta japonica]|uniref:Uncharacterized protein n=1 Tax=Eumeta variegata TaxID=151549 RepID=A0A4C1V077_EUMVA|nr:hypothetical protein EVAR_80920_1 [Eumeta japonica]